MSDADDNRALAASALACLDLTSLGDADTPDSVAPLYGKMRGAWGHVAALCVWPRIVPYAKAATQGTGIKVATVVNFPKGAAHLAIATAETRASLAYGADEVDMVFPYHAFLEGDGDRAGRMVRALKDICGSAITLKVILETGALPGHEAITRASHIAIDNGADFLKTSTGKIEGQATPEAAEAMLGAIKASGAAHVGFKASGGIRSFDQARAYLAQADAIMGEGWAKPATFRFGASGLADALAKAWAGDVTAESRTGY